MKDFLDSLHRLRLSKRGGAELYRVVRQTSLNGKTRTETSTKLCLPPSAPVLRPITYPCFLRKYSQSALGLPVTMAMPIGRRRASSSNTPMAPTHKRRNAAGQRERSGQQRGALLGDSIWPNGPITSLGRASTPLFNNPNPPLSCVCLFWVTNISEEGNKVIHLIQEQYHEGRRDVNKFGDIEN